MYSYAKRVFLCTGSHPSTSKLHEAYNPDIKVLDLDEVLRYSHLPDILPLSVSTPTSPSGTTTTTETTSNTTSHAASILAPMSSSKPSSAPIAAPVYTIAVIGNSHSGILVCRNLHTYSNSLFHTQPHYGANANGTAKPIKILLFHRRAIKYAKYLDEGGIVFDNTGLKGDTADWAQEVLEGKEDDDVLERINISGEGREDLVYKERLKECTHIVYAVGYERNPLPKIIIRGESREGELQFDMHSSGFYIPVKDGLNGEDNGGEDVEEEGVVKRERVGKRVKGLYGCGIAFPEEVEDPEGHVETAVGLGKFFKFAERVKDDWVGIR